MLVCRKDFYTIFQEEGYPFYNALDNLNRDNFNKWVSKKFSLVKTINTFDEVIPTREQVKAFLELGYNHKPSQCHYSAKAISLLNPEFEFWTGFIHRKDFIYPIITHSFNLKDFRIIDFSRLNDKLEIIDIASPYFPHLYYGIKVPNEMLMKYHVETLKEYSMNPLLYEMYLEEGL